jgi:acetyltransferase
VKTLVARTAAEAVSFASEIGYPVAMKALSPQVIHKSKIDGVVLNVCSSSHVQTVFNQLFERVKGFRDDARFEGVAVQPMVSPKGYELILGSKKDPLFGAVIVFGAGGINAELQRDISIGFPPLNQVLARHLIEGTAVFKQAFAVGLPLNVKFLEEVLIRFAQLVVDFPEIKEVDINPLMVDKSSGVAVDARIVLDIDRMAKPSFPHEHLVIAPYPKKYVSSWTLKDGTSLMLRPIKPEDEGRFNKLFQSLSVETMRLRFFEIIKEMSHETLTRYCNLDYDREVALVVEVQGGERDIIGAVRLILEPNEKSGEFAVLVGDKWQGRGLGSRLMDAIIDVAKDMRMETFYGYVLANNYKMLTMITKKGFKIQPYDEDTVKAVLELA